MNKYSCEIYEKYKSLYFKNDKSFLSFSKDLKLDTKYKRLFQSRVLMRNKNWQQAIELLSKLNETDLFTMGEKFILLGTAYIYTSEYRLATQACSQAAIYFKEVGYNEGIFNSYYNNSVAYNRLGLDEESLLQLKKCQEYTNDQGQNFAILRALACYHSRKCEFDLALTYLDRANKIGKIELDEIDQLVFQTVYIDILIRAKKYEDALILVNKLYSRKINRERYRVLYYKSLLNSLIKGTSIKVNSNLSGEVTEYSLKWTILECLQNGDFQKATDDWNQLRRQSPELYDENFQFKDESESLTIFAILLKRYIFAEEIHDICINELGIRSKNGKKLVETLIEIGAPTRKEDLIESIWNIEYDPKYDSRFYKLIERMRNNSLFTIASKNYTYSFELNQQTAA